VNHHAKRPEGAFAQLIGAEMHLVVLCGGAGTRLWPLSRSDEPKQFLRLPEDTSLLEQTLARMGVYGIESAPFIVCGREHASLVQAHAGRGVAKPRVIVEPDRRNTAPAIAAVAELVAREDPQALMLVTPADHFIADAENLGRAVRAGAELAREGAIVTFGITPRDASPNYGYIELGKPVSRDAHKVERFIEKPPVEAAEEFIRSKNFVWNSGIFLFRADVFLAELRRFEPEIAAAVANAVSQSSNAGGDVRLDAESFRASPDKSIDYAIMEKTDRAVVVPVALDWSDLGSWQALWEVTAKDDAGNVRQGDVLAIDCRDTFLRSDSRLLAAIGVNNLVVVDTPDALLVATKDQAQNVKSVVEELRLRRRPQADTSPVVTRPWGTFQTICETPNYKVKRIFIFPGSAISLQYHHRRSEYWTIVRGSGVLTVGDAERTVSRGDTAFIPVKARHRLRNTAKDLLEFVEVQLGDYLGEDDIVRINDDYGRA
jgi:mannose-1-phosphate guanylyltransferase/mannose-6-phosphate isomerase